MQVNWLLFFRKTHLYVGVFTAPAILFFAFTGAMQSFSLHETTRGSAYQPPRWIVILAQLHKKQTAQIPVRKGPPPQVPPTIAPAERKPEPAAPPPSQHMPLKIFFLVVAVSLFVSTISGIYLAWKYRRNRVLVTALLLAGILAPILLVQF